MRERLAHGRVIVDPGALQPVQAGNLQFAVGNAGSDYDRPGNDFAFIRKPKDPGGSFDPPPNHSLRSKDFAAKTPALGDSSSSEVASAQSGGKAEIFFNP